MFGNPDIMTFTPWFHIAGGVWHYFTIQGLGPWRVRAYGNFLGSCIEGRPCKAHEGVAFGGC